MRIKQLNKRGDIRTLAPTELVGYILGGLVLVLVLIVVGVFTAFYFSEKYEEFAINNFIALANSVESLSKSQQQFNVQRAFPFYLPSDYIVVGFGKEWDNTKLSDSCPPEEAVRKPDLRDGKEGEKCIGSACICLFGHSNDNFMNNDGTYNVRLIQCRALPNVDYMPTMHLTDSSNYGYPPEVYYNLIGQEHGLSDYSQINFKDYAFFYIYGQCDGYWWDKDIGSRKVYLEKFTDSANKNYVFIAAEGSPAIEDRYTKMNARYGKLTKEEYISKIKIILEKEAASGTNLNEKLEAINNFLSLNSYYGFTEEIKPYLMKLALLYLSNQKDFKAKLDTMIQSMGMFKVSSVGDDMINSQLFLSRLEYMKSTAQSSRMALLEMQNLIDSNSEKYKAAVASPAPASSCSDYGKKVRNGENDLGLLFQCSQQLLDKEYDIGHVLVYAGKDEEFKIDNYKIKINKVKLGEESIISIYKYNEAKKDYLLVKCNGKDELKLAIGNNGIGADGYNSEIESKGSDYSLNRILAQCAS